MQNRHKSASSSSSSAKSPRMMIDSYISSQSEVEWKIDSPIETYESPRRAVKTKSVNDLDQTPVRIIKRHISSPVFNNNKITGLVRKLQDCVSEDENNLTTQKEEDEFNLSGENFEIFHESPSPAPKIEKLNLKMTPVARNSQADNYFEDSFDDSFLNSIPLDEISKQVAGSSTCNVEIFIDEKLGLSQVVRKPLLRHISDPFSKNESSSNTNRPNEVKKSFERHNSLPASPKTVPAAAQPKVSTEDSAAPRLCTPAEIAEKKRLALERLAMKKEASKPIILPVMKRPTASAESSMQPPIKRLCTKAEIEEKRKMAMERLQQTKKKNEQQKNKKN